METIAQTQQKDSTIFQKLSAIVFLILWMGPPLFLATIAQFFTIIRNGVISMYSNTKDYIMSTIVGNI